MPSCVAILDEQHCEADVPGTAIRHPSAPQNGKTRKPDFSRVVRIAALSILLGGLSLSASAAEPHRAKPKHKPTGQVGQASWYDYKDGSKTASGQKISAKALTAAHRTMPFGSKLRVTNIRTGKSVIVVVNDRGPFHGKRIIDVNRRAAQKLGLIQIGVAQVRVERVVQVAEASD
ncbi:septal ring lytic transglycosylase RlpA family protein [Azospirillum cavernae]|uniref:Endolytic peptidoglycan transglycosylase RlpA n=1 Tax=Azospirillum cavernae TaxID=2320860 RepID=A0A418VV66_9PROT|nr:septal ring lytic transglycosylase RlpA family protein [Azospirillum cavernae]